jgi:26S proteasome regulatory subunit N13
MASSALFGTGGGQVRGVKNLVEFKAGKMTLKDKMVQPDKRKGLVYVYQSEDSLMHFCWKDRSTGIVEDVILEMKLNL